MDIRQKTPKLPCTIKVAAFDIAVNDWHHHSASANLVFGQFSCLEQEIKIDTSVSKHKVLDTFLHELNHAIYWAYGIEDEDKEERVVSTMATAMVQIYRDNPDVIRYIKEMMDA